MHNKCWLVTSIITLMIYVSPVTHSQEFFDQEQAVENQWQSVNIEQYQVSADDHLIVYLSDGVAFLTNENTKIFAKFPILSGKQKNVYYIGRYYFAATPEKEWDIKGKDIKRDRFTFGKTGRFFRLFDENGSTPYGIHGLKNAEKLMEKGEIYASMGCVIVPENVLDVIEASYITNGKNIHVTTTSDSSKIANFLAI